jgi:hypothetical protein
MLTGDATALADIDGDATCCFDDEWAAELAAADPGLPEAGPGVAMRTAAAGVHSFQAARERRRMPPGEGPIPAQPEVEPPPDED